MDVRRRVPPQSASPTAPPQAMEQAHELGMRDHLGGLDTTMRVRLVFLLFLFALVAAACGGGADVPLGSEVHGQFTTNAEGATMSPDFTITLADGETWSLADQQKPTIVLFWANW